MYICIYINIYGIPKKSYIYILHLHMYTDKHAPPRAGRLYCERDRPVPPWVCPLFISQFYFLEMIKSLVIRENVLFSGDLPNLPPWLCPLFVSPWVENGLFLDDVSCVFSLFLISLRFLSLRRHVSSLPSLFLCSLSLPLSRALDTHTSSLSLSHALSLSRARTQPHTDTHTQITHTQR